MKMTEKQKETMKILGVAFIIGIILTICLHLTEGSAAPPNFL
jgi:hypothetical protein